MGKLLLFLSLLPVSGLAGEPVALSEKTYDPSLGVLIIQVNWGRTWKCGQFEHAQLQALTFTQLPLEGANSVVLELQTHSQIAAENTFLPYAYVVQPGEYQLTDFDVAVAKSKKEVIHLKGAKEDMAKAPQSAGTFTIQPGEIVYVGHFGLDCTEEPFLWRFYIEGRSEFESYIAGFRQKFPFVKEVPVQFKLFSTQRFGNPYALENPTVH
ncbi:MAG: hypothetical protein KDC71_22520 [Acidobacteria bacterium]|nr:hypothetical protein [Acidobacteriota bacterium]